MQCLVAVVIGITLRFIINRRRFNRRSFIGSQQFNSYFSSVVIVFVEKLMMLAANIAIVGGVLLFLTGK
jgi:hypothetical protein